mgnify:CR=1 FL=1
MSKYKYMVLLRNKPGQPNAPAKAAPSPEQMQQMFAAYSAWKEKFKAQILDMGDKLNDDGRVITGADVADGPFVEAKEIVGGFMIVSAASYEEAIEVVQAGPMARMPGVSLEIRQMAGRSM